MLQFRPRLAVPIPPTSLPWISQLMADEPSSTSKLLSRVISDEPWLLCLAVCSSDACLGGPPAGEHDLSRWNADWLSDRFEQDLRVSTVSVDLLDHWRAAYRRTRSLIAHVQAMGTNESECTPFDRAGRLAYFSDCLAWLTDPESAILGQADDDSDDEKPYAAHVPSWLVGLVERVQSTTIDEDELVAKVQGCRERLLDNENASPWRVDGLAPFAQSRDEQVIEFVESVRRMAARNRQRRNLEQRFAETVEQEKLRAMKELAYGASHEVNNPLANIATRAQTLLRDETDADRRRSLATINAQAFRAHEMISDMMLFARPPRLDKKPCNLVELVRTVLDELKQDAVEQQTALELQAGDDVISNIDPTHLGAAVRAICLNALEALRADGEIQVRVRQESSDGLAPVVSVEIEDNGPGIPDDIRPRIFEPYYSGREAGRGLGLGLSKAWAVVHEHGGSVEVVQVSPQGTKMTILLPQGEVGPVAKPLTST
jgi:signal transduction histidine kinase